jgi:transcriptional regulator with XRE-family HTH domain
VIGEERRKARTKAGLSQEELGFRAKLSRNYISLVELDQNSPTVTTLHRICSALGVKMSHVIAQAERRIERGRVGTSRRRPR